MRNNFTPVDILPQDLSSKFLNRFWAKVNRTETCWIWTACKSLTGYGQIGREKSRDRFAAHRVSWVIENGPIADGLLVLHRCDNPSCVRPSHLFLGTDADNVNDMIEKGREAKGFSFPQTKLSNDQILYIRRAYSYGITQVELAQEFGVCQPHISDIVNNLRRKG